MSTSRTTNPAQHHSTNQSGTSLQIPQEHRSQSTHSTPRSVDQSVKSRTSTRQSNLSNTTVNTNSTSLSAAVSDISSNLRPGYYPSSGYPTTHPLPGPYPRGGYPISQLEHSYGYPSANFPVCEVPGVVDLRMNVHYPSSEFPGGGIFPGEMEQDDGSLPFIGAEASGGGYPGYEPLGVVGGGGGYPSGRTMYYHTSDMAHIPSSLDPLNANVSGYPT